MQVQPYLFFDGRCEEALDFYKAKLGAEVTMLMRFGESPEPPSPEMCASGAPDFSAPGFKEKVMHSNLKNGDSELMASDGMAGGKPKFEGFSLSLTATDEAQAQRLFAKLADGGKVQMPLMKTFFSPRFGMVADKFGVGWMIIVEPKAPKAA